MEDQYSALAGVSGVLGFFAIIETFAYTHNIPRESAAFTFLCQSWTAFIYVALVGSFMIPLRYTMNCTWITPLTGSLFVFYHALSLLYFANRGIRVVNMISGSRMKISYMVSVFLFSVVASPLVIGFLTNPWKDSVTYACYDNYHLPWILTTAMYWITLLFFVWYRYMRPIPLVMEFPHRYVSSAFVVYTLLLTGCMAWLYYWLVNLYPATPPVPFLYVDWFSMLACHLLLRAIDVCWIPQWCTRGKGRTVTVHVKSSPFSPFSPLSADKGDKGEEVESV